MSTIANTIYDIAEQLLPYINRIQELEKENLRLQEKLAESEEHYQAIFKNSLDGILLTLPDGIILAANPAACRVFGGSEEELCAAGWQDISDLEDPRFWQAMDESEKTGSITSEMTLLRKDGTKFEAEVTSNQFKDRHGQIQFYLTIRDITMRNQAAAALRLSEVIFYQIFHQSQIMMSISRLSDGLFIDVNNTFAAVFGYRREELIGSSALELKHWVDPQERQAIIRQLLTDGYIQSFEIRFRKKSGEVVFALSTISLLDIGGEKYLLVSGQDITARKQAEEALRLSEEKFAKLFYYSQTGIAITRLEDGVFLDVNETFAAGVGYSRSELIGKSVFETNLWADLKDRQAMLQLLAEDGYTKNFETSYRKKTGELSYALAAFNMLDLDGNKCILTSVIDITEQKKAIEDLRQSKELFYQTFNSNPLPMCIITKQDETYLEVNEALLQSSGFTREELIGHKTTDLNNWADLRERDQFRAIAYQKGLVNNYEARLMTRAGDLTIVLLSQIPILWNNEECFLVITSDITELRRYQQEMTRLAQLNLVGEMAAGIGHEIRNPMTMVRGFLQLLGSKDRYGQDKEYLDLMIEELDRVNNIITEFLTLAKDKPVEKRRQSLNQKVRTLLPLIHADAMKQEKNIQVELGDIPYLVIDKNEITQLILNLVRNGLEAMSPGGVLFIKTYKDAGGVVLAVQDQGPGIAPEILAKIGTPFVTTKDSGTGLGLAVCYSIARRHNAEIDIESGAAGTTFYVRFNI